MKNKLKSGNEKCCIIVKNLPLYCNRSDIKKLFQKYGHIQRVELLRKKKANFAGDGIVEFSSVEAVKEAVRNCSGLIFKGRRIKVKRKQMDNGVENHNKSNSKQVVEENSNGSIDNNDNDNNSFNAHDSSGEDIDDVEEKKYLDVEKEDCIDKNYIKMENDDFYTSKKLNQQKEGGRNPECDKKILKSSKRGRIIIRNLPFLATEEDIQKHFKPFGKIKEIKLLKNKEGKRMRYGFIQFKTRKSATEAVSKMNGQDLMGRTIICDMAVSQSKYLQQMQHEASQNVVEVKIKEEPLSDGENDESKVIPNYDIKIEEDDSFDLDTSEIKIEKEFVKSLPQKNEEEDDDSDDSNNSDDNSDYDKGHDDDDDDDDDDDVSEDHSVKEEEEDGYLQCLSGNNEKKPKVISNDVTEGCTVFIKNIPFSATKGELEKCMEQFGPLNYAVICIDHVTEHPKGTGFAKFRKREDAEKCIEQSGYLTLGNSTLEILPALSRNDIKDISERKKEKISKDNRNLYLAKEGVIYANSYAARGVSVADMEKRLKIEQWKSQMLRNLHMFISKTRLIIYNIPLSWNDGNVRQLFKKYAGQGAIIKEARVMRNMKKVGSAGGGESKGYAFVQFTEHEHALNALRNINNNPNIFSAAKRPIVTFSIENKAILRIKEKRMEKSRLRNQKQENQDDHISLKSQKREKKKRNQKNLKQNSKVQEKELHVNDSEKESFVGEAGKPGSKKMRSNFKLKAQAAQHMQNVKERKRKSKLKNIFNQRKKIKHDVMPKPTQKIKEKDTFGHLVAKYKATVGSLEAQKRWYE